MYNRYIPDENGCYRCTVVETEKQSVSKPPAVQAQLSAEAPAGSFVHRNPVASLLPSSLDSGDLLVLLILLLILVDGGEEDRLSILVTITAFLLL